ncbi:MAG: nitrophenyl compound nitroreductase subunit ArsF family protein [Candidatus Pacebacteria bacterium]|jgi:hypothetical protein|nr:nitrophenyl compound nitroreductase subunit ArsF family protein [Candidatus Paceibacterota bacterium]
MKKNIIIITALGAIAVLGIISAFPKEDATGGQATGTAHSVTPRKDTGNMSVAMVPAEKVEVFLFHRTQRCTTCIAIGKLSGQTVQEEFGPEVLSGKAVFREVNIDEPENKALAEKFHASGSSLFINAIRNGSDNIQEDAQVWGLTGDAEAFKNYLAGQLNVLLGK